MKASLAIGCLLCLAASSHADDEASNFAHVSVSRWGRCYAKSVPQESYGLKGTTQVYAVSDTTDRLIHTFDWYSPSIYLECHVGRPNQRVATSVVQFGPWARGQAAAAEHIALSFYFDGKLVRRYSTLDIAGRPDNVLSSVSHYGVIERVLGYRAIESNFSVFEIVTTDGRRLTFDPTTGDILATEPAPAR